LTTQVPLSRSISQDTFLYDKFYYSVCFVAVINLDGILEANGIACAKN